MKPKIENIELPLTPLTKQLLIKFVTLKYEEYADISDDSLRAELIWLHNNNQLDQLFLCEYLTSDLRLKSIFDGN